MKRIIDLSQERKNILFETTAREMKVSNTIIEKDFWVCVVLNYLFNESKFKDYFVFKGGTSLSKCYGDAYIPSAVKLEIGPVAAKTPTEIKQIEPYCFKCFNVDNKEPFKVEIASIARTFWEKLLILYAETNRPLDKKVPSRYSRHYYDVYMIYKSEYFSTILKMKELFQEVKAFKSKYYRTSWSKIEESSLDNIAIVPRKERLTELSSDFDNMKEMIFGDGPSFKEIINGLLELEGVLKRASSQTIENIYGLQGLIK